MTYSRLLRITLCLAGALLLLLLGGGAPARAFGPAVTTGADRIVVTGGAAGETISLTIDGAGRLAMTGLALAPGAIPGGCDWDGYRLSCPQAGHVEVDLGVAGEHDTIGRSSASRAAAPTT